MDYKPGDVFQIIESHGLAGWIGCFVLATEIKSWGIMGFVAMIETHESQGHAYIRLPWEHIEYVGSAPLVPKSVEERNARDSAKENLL